MAPRFTSGLLRREFTGMLGLAATVITAELGWMSMGVVDTIMVGRVGAAALGAVSVGRVLFMTVVVFGMGLLLGLDTLVSKAHGAGRTKDCKRYLLQGVYLSLGVGLPMTLLIRAGASQLGRWGIDPEVLDPAVTYMRALSWGALPLVLYSALRRYLQAVERARPVMIALVSANLINLAGNWILIFGKLGAPKMGAEGAAWSTVTAAWYMAGFLAVATWMQLREDGSGLAGIALRPRLFRLRRLVGLGLPAASQLTVEVGVFATATALAGRLSPSALAAHHVALTWASVTFMFPLGISAAGAVRVGHALGRRDGAGARRAGWAAILLAGIVMLFSGLAFLLFPRELIRLVTPDPSVAAAGVPLMRVAALFQLSDGLQVAATGVLRGIADTRTALIWNLIAHWLIGLPLGYHLCFVRGLGVTGLWIGLAQGLVLLGVVLMYVWWRKSCRLAP